MSTDEEKVDISDDASTAESSNIAPLWSPVFTTDTELDISLLSVEANSQDANITSLENLPTFKLIGDNLALYIRPQSETADHHAESKHFFMHSQCVTELMSLLWTTASLHWIFPP